MSDTGLTGLSALDCTPAAPATLAPGEVLTCTATKTMTQAEADAGSVTNTATATGSPPGGAAPVTGSDDETVKSAATPAIELTKSADQLTYLAGDVVTYTFNATNTGTTTLTDVEVSDTGLTGLSALDCAPAAPATLAPGEVLTCTATKTMTQAEADAGSVTNTATVTGRPPASCGCDDVTASDDVTATSSAVGGVNLEKVANLRDKNGNSKADVGEVIEYAFKVSNTGGLTLTNVTVDDPMLGGEVACTPNTLAPSEMVTCGPVEYTVTRADVDLGEIVNRATASGDDGQPGTMDPVDDDTTTTPTSPGTPDVPDTGDPTTTPPTAGTPVLPETGASTAMTACALLGAGLLLAGSLAMALGRRRRRNA